MEILQGLRETPIPNTPENYVKIYTGKCSYLIYYNLFTDNLELNIMYFFLDCWSDEPDNRPTINQVISKLEAIIKDFKPYNSDNDANVSLPSESLCVSKISEFSENLIYNF